MCNQACIEFGKSNLRAEDIRHKSVIEVGSLNVNGSLRSIVDAFAPHSYIGVDIQMGPGVDKICCATDLLGFFGHEVFDLVICTELLEHVRNWRLVISNLKGVLKPNGILLITTRSIDFPYHGYPFDFWRFQKSDMEIIFSDFRIEVLENDPESPGVFLRARKPNTFKENDLISYQLFSVIKNKRVREISDLNLNLCRLKFHLNSLQQKFYSDLRDIIILLKNFLKTILKPNQVKRLRELLDCLTAFIYYLKLSIYSGDLIKLAILFETDKWNSHWYAKHYQKYFYPLRFKKLNILEIGAGGYEDPNKGAESLKMWKAFFPNSMIYGIDIYDKKALEEKRIKIFQGDQSDAFFLKAVTAKIGRLDIIIDDGSHLNEHVIKTFETLFPFLNEGGIYVVEDTQTSYWPDSGGTSDDLNYPKTVMNYFKGLADSLNYQEFIRAGYVPSYFDKHIIGLHFYHNLIFIFKGNNNEGSNFIRDNSTRA